MIAWSTWTPLKKVAFVGLIAFVIIIIILGAGISWILISPLFLEGETLDEELPDVINVVDNSTVTTMGNETITMTDSNTSSGQFTLISQGELQDADASHHGSGIVQLVKNNELGNYSIFFRDVEITNGPRLVVYLTNEDKEFTEMNKHANLGNLRATIGNFSMDVPESEDPTEYNTLIVWCEPFDVLFAFANLNSPG